MIVVLSTLFGCPKNQPAPPETPASAEIPPDAFDEARKVVIGQMHAHFVLVEEARNAVIRGEIDEARAAGERLRDIPTMPDPPTTWLQRLDSLAVAANDLAEAPDLDAAGVAVGKIGAVCGGCHGEQDAGLEAPFGRPPQQSDMARHEYAVDGMWLALVSANPQDFGLASQALAGVKGYFAEDAPHLPAEFVPLDEHVHEVARQGVSAEAADQPRVMGELLATCAACHDLFEVGPSKR